MAFAALRPRSVTEIVDAAFQVLRAHYGQFVMCSALAYLPWLIIELLFLNDPERIANTEWWVGIAVAFGVWLSFALMSAVIMTCASQAYLGDPVDVGEAVRRALPRLPRVMIAAVLRYILMFVGLFGLLVGALYVVARLFALTPAIILEDASLVQAFDRTSFLSKDRKWHILNTLGLVGLIYWVIGLGVTVLAVASGNAVVSTLCTAFYTILAYPVIAITECLLYYDARIQTEGLDLELMAGELGLPSPSEPVGP
ncbi:MAG: hypothetical protein JWM95_639 [Gemmatimonadetes bacterium]|nr:hypothetical protein [Gemmatimonadota bacterium]